MNGLLLPFAMVPVTLAQMECCLHVKVCMCVAGQPWFQNCAFSLRVSRLSYMPGCKGKAEVWTSFICRILAQLEVSAGGGGRRPSPRTLVLPLLETVFKENSSLR